MISKELLSEVLNIDDIVHIQKEGISDLFISRANNPAIIINIYELAHKCKEWAFNNGYYLKSYKMVCCKCEAVSIHNKHLVEIFLSNSEYDSIIDSCQWILEKKGEKMNIPIYRAKKIDSDEYIKGTGTTDFLNINNISGFEHYNDGTRLWLWSNYFWIEIDPTTLAIHFPDAINTNSEKVWYNLEEISNIVKEYKNGKMETN